MAIPEEIKPTPTRWEYKELRTTGPDKVFLVNFHPDADALPVQDQRPIERVVAQLGQQGWELVTVAFLANEAWQRWIFKRPRPL